MTDVEPFYAELLRSDIEAAQAALAEWVARIGRHDDRRADGFPVRLHCPRGHKLLTVRLDEPESDRPALRPLYMEGLEGPRQVAHPTDDSPGWRGLPPRTDWCVALPKCELRCPEKGCRFKERVRLPRLLGLYLDALEGGRDEVTLGTPAVR